jgi:NADPH-dependent curcumin reductase CurA
MGAGASTESLSTPHLWRNILVRKLSVNGYIISDHWSNYISFVSEVEPMVASGSIKYQEDVVTGIENAPDAFIGLLNGRNLGKLVIEV